MLAIATKYALAKEATLNNRDSKKDKSRVTRISPGPSKSRDKKKEVGLLRGQRRVAVLQQGIVAPTGRV
jgi:hypothetical protein